MGKNIQNGHMAQKISLRSSPEILKIHSKCTINTVYNILF